MDIITIIAWVFTAAVAAWVLLWAFVLVLLLWEVGNAAYRYIRSKA